MTVEQNAIEAIGNEDLFDEIEQLRGVRPPYGAGGQIPMGGGGMMPPLAQPSNADTYYLTQDLAMQDFVEMDLAVLLGSRKPLLPYKGVISHLNRTSNITAKQAKYYLTRLRLLQAEIRCFIPEDSYNATLDGILEGVEFYAEFCVNDAVAGTRVRAVTENRRSLQLLNPNPNQDRRGIFGWFRR